MCLAIPMKIIEINGHVARCNSKGIEREINCFLLQDCSLSVDDFVMVHVGYAIQKIDPDHAQIAWQIDDHMRAISEHEKHA